MLRVGTPSLFLSPAAAVFLISSLEGVASKGQVFHPTSTRPFMQNFLPAQRRGTFTRREPEWIESAAQLVSLRAGFWLDAKTGRFPFSGGEKPLLFVEKDYHILPGLWQRI